MQRNQSPESDPVRPILAAMIAYALAKQAPSVLPEGIDLGGRPN